MIKFTKYIIEEIKNEVSIPSTLHLDFTERVLVNRSFTISTLNLGFSYPDLRKRDERGPRGFTRWKGKDTDQILYVSTLFSRC